MTLIPARRARMQLECPTPRPVLASQLASRARSAERGAEFLVDAREADQVPERPGANSRDEAAFPNHVAARLTTEGPAESLEGAARLTAGERPEAQAAASRSRQCAP